MWYNKSMICIACGKNKSLDEFYKDKKMLSGHRSNCKLCHKLTEIPRHKKNKALRGYATKSYIPPIHTLKNYEPPKPRWTKYNPTDKYYSRRGQYSHSGLSHDQFKALYESQNGLCSICGRGEDEVGTLHIDHDHSCCPGQKTCGKCNRGMLCGSCNRGIGCLQDDIGILQSATKYLKKFRV